MESDPESTTSARPAGETASATCSPLADASCLVTNLPPSVVLAAFSMDGGPDGLVEIQTTVARPAVSIPADGCNPNGKLAPSVTGGPNGAPAAGRTAASTCATAG